MLRSATSKAPKKVGGPWAFPAAIEGIVVRRVVVSVAVVLAMLVAAGGVAMAAVYQGSALPNEYYGTTQNDTIYGYGMGDILYGSPPELVGSGIDNINGGVGSDVMNGMLGPDSIAGQSGNDWMSDGPIKDGMQDKLSGGDGSDTIISNNYPRATDVITCGTGVDKVYADSLDTFQDRTNCETVTIYNPKSATDPAAAYEAPEPCDLDPTQPCTPNSRVRFR